MVGVRCIVRNNLTVTSPVGFVCVISITVTLWCGFVCDYKRKTGCVVFPPHNSNIKI